MSKPFLFLFEGNDFLKSRDSMAVWVKKYQAKYGDASHYKIDGDELSSDEALKQLDTIIHEQSLFSSHRLIQIIRPHTFDASARSTANSQKIVTLLQSLRTRAQDTTVILYCDTHLSDSHPYKKMTASHEWAKLYHYETPVVRLLISEELEGIGMDELDNAVMVHLDQQLHALHQVQRSELRLRSNDVIPQDQSRGWLRSMCQNIVALGESHKDLKNVIGEQFSFTSPFALINALQAQQFGRARECLKSLTASPDFNVFMIMALLQRARLDERSGYKGYVQYLSAQLEIYVKNGVKDHAALLYRFIDVLEIFSKDGRKDSLLPERTMWLASL